MGTALVNPSPVIPGTLTVNGTMFAALVKAFGGLDVPVAGQGLAVAEGANAKQGTFVLAGAATTTVANTSVTASSRILLTSQVDGGTPGTAPRVQSRIPGTSFTVAATATDTSTVAYEIIEPG